MLQLGLQRKTSDAEEKIQFHVEISADFKMKKETGYQLDIEVLLEGFER